MRALVYAAALGWSLGLVPAVTATVAAEEPEQSADHERMMASAKVVQSMYDTARKGDFEGWLRHFDSDVTYIVNNNVIIGRAELRKIFSLFNSDLKAAKMEAGVSGIIDSGWTGERVYIWQTEYLADIEIVTYSEFEVRRGKIVTVVASF